MRFKKHRNHLEENFTMELIWIQLELVKIRDKFKRLFGFISNRDELVQINR